MPVTLSSVGGGSATISVGSTANNYSLNAPTSNGTLVSTGDTGSVSTTMLADTSVTAAKLATAVLPLGYNQTWQDVTGSRTAGTTYTNSTGRPIMVAVSATTGTSIGMTAVVGGVTVQNMTYNGSSGSPSISVIVPDNTTYVFNFVAGSVSTWVELR